MAINLGKKFEEKIKECWYKTMPDSFILRLPDQQSGYAHTSSNICDFIGFKSPNCYFIECKSIHGNTLPLANLHQYEKMLPYKDVKNLFIGFLVWWVDLDKVAWVPLNTIIQIKNENKKSVHINMLDDKNYYTVSIPSVKKKVFMESDLSVLETVHK